MKTVDVQGSVNALTTVRKELTVCHLSSFHPEMVFLANLGVNLHVCLRGGDL
ncbi:hypothetical protein TRIP_B200618 [uncultured Desulfatiglans sp.]|uniref:Uncharacterized protein n=1 Tax=Uncultured Desulfatiglans sp. TaxID=1748965 RepID=A0A653A3G8_UNCDX|nr:hypothetical protein TRIP_B200618 [uncultured Desulfatiglans sp.]